MAVIERGLMADSENMYPSVDTGAIAWRSSPRNVDGRSRIPTAVPKLVWVRKELVVKRSFTSVDCFPAGEN
jgi:hypothetical protein